MSGALTFLLIVTLLRSAECRSFLVTMPESVNVMRGSCVTVPCSFDIDSQYDKDLNENCKSQWIDTYYMTPKLTETNPEMGDVTEKNCTTTFNNMQPESSNTYHFRVECDNVLKWTFKPQSLRMVVTDNPPPPTLSPSTLKVNEGTSVNLTCSAPAPCQPHPPVLTWTPKLGESQETLQENKDKTKVQTSVLTFNASQLHHGQKISCIAVYKKQDGSADASVTSTLTADILYSPQNTTVSVSPSGPVPETSNVTLTCSSDANPAVKIYTWFRSDGDQETVIGTGSVLNIQASEVRQPFFCKVENDLGTGNSTKHHIDVQYLPKMKTLLVSPSGPVREYSNVTLTCSSDANPPGQNYTWFRADGDQEMFIGTGSVLHAEVSKDKQRFFCKAENDLGVGRSNITHIDVQYFPKHTTVSVSLSGPVPETSNVTLTCSSDANPPVKNYTWFRADGDQDTLIGTGSVINIQASEVKRHFFCKAENNLGVGRSTFSHIDVHYSPKDTIMSVCPSGPIPEDNNVTLICSSDANPAVRLYIWYRDDAGQETLIGIGPVINIQASKVRQPVFCKAENYLGVGNSTKHHIDVQYPPRNTTVSVSPSGPVPENSNVTLTCSSDANPAVRIYTWFRADGDQETLNEAGPVLNTKVSKLRWRFVCKTENDLGVGQSTFSHIDVQYSPQNTTVSVSPSGPVPETSNVTLTCSSDANPAVRIYTWFRSDGDQETLIGTGSVLNIQASEVRQPFYCKVENDLGIGNSTKHHIDVQYSPKVITASVSPSGPVPETSNVTLTCSSDANPPVKNYTWFRADGDQETFIGTGPILNMEISRISQHFFCKAENYLGVGRSNLSHIDVQYFPLKTTISVSPSGPVAEDSNVTLTCSSDANPPVKNYTWFRADGDQETLIGTGSVLNITTTRVTSVFICKGENYLGVGRSKERKIDVQFPPQILLSSNCTKTSGQVHCSCQTVGNPSPSLHWYLDGLLVKSSKFKIINEFINRTSLRSFITVNETQERDLSTLLCRSVNSLGSASQQFCVNSLQMSTEQQVFESDSGVLPWVIASLSAAFSLICIAYILLVYKRRQNEKAREKDKTCISLQHKDAFESSDHGIFFPK